MKDLDYNDGLNGLTEKLGIKSERVKQKLKKYAELILAKQNKGITPDEAALLNTLATDDDMQKLIYEWILTSNKKPGRRNKRE